MNDVRRVIVAFLILLFVIVGIGVLLTRAARNKTDRPVIGGVFERIFFPESPTPTLEEEVGVIVRTDDETISITGKPTSGLIDDSSDDDTTSKGGNEPVQQSEPTNIPNTGSPTALLFISLAGLGSGVFLRRKY